MRKAKSIFENIDSISVILYIILVFFGWINIYASQYNDDNTILLDMTARHGKQFIFIGVSFIVAFTILIIDWKFFDGFSYFFYAITILLLIGVLLIGEATNSSVSWFEIGRFKIQPSEFAKFTTALALSKYFSEINKKIQLRKKLTAYLIVLIPFLLIILQNDTGTALVFFAFSLVFYREGISSNILMLGGILLTLLILTFLIDKMILIIIFSFLATIIFFFSRRKWKEIKFIIICWILIIGAILSINYVTEEVLLDHHIKRINILLGQEIDPQGAGYNLIQSKIAIGSGGFFGKGFLNGTQTRFDFVPEQSTDFIFCTIGEQWGFLGASIFILCFIGLILRIFFIAERQRSNFSRMYGYSVGCILFIHFVINIGMTIGLSPVIGIPLPFISYGGSALLGFTILLFILLNLDSYRLQILR